MDLALYYYDECPYCRRVLAAMKELGVSGVTMKNTLRERAHRAELAQLTGRTQVPCLTIDGKAMFESADIVEWLRANRARIPA